MKQTFVYVVALAGAISCLVVYLALSLTPLVLALRKAREERKTLIGGTEEERRAFMGPLTGFVTALAALVEAMAKAGPVLSSLVGSLLFLLIAAFAAGLFPSLS